MAYSDLHCSLGPSLVFLDRSWGLIPPLAMSGLLPVACSACHVQLMQDYMLAGKDANCAGTSFFSLLPCGVALLLALPDNKSPRSTPYPLDTSAHFIRLTVGKELW